MKKSKVVFRKEHISNLVLADWNYKEDDEAMKQKLIANIKENGFLQNIVIRKLEDKFEVVDGNHRLVALQEIGQKQVNVCDVGVITDEQAYTIAISLNETSFENNEWRLANLMKSLSTTQSIEKLSEFMPFTQGEIGAMVNTAEIDFENLNNPPGDMTQQTGGFNTITFQVKDDIYEKWLLWCKQIEQETQQTSRAYAFEQMLLTITKN